MTTKQIITEAIEVAEKNDWDFFGMANHLEDEERPAMGCEPFLVEGEYVGFWYCWDMNYPEEGSLKFSETDLLFNHDFAKAFWGEDFVVKGSGINWNQYYQNWIDRKGTGDKRTMAELTAIAQNDWNYWKKTGYVIPAWQYHLQKMVLAEVPERYLEKYL